LYSLYPGPEFDRTEVIQEGIFDVYRIYMTCVMNCFAWGDNELFVLFDGDYFSQFPTSSGLMIVASFANHSCISNASRSMLSDMILYHANYDIKAGEEITIAYDRNTWDTCASVAIKSREKLQHWFPQCDCGFCEAMRSNVKASRIEELLAISETAIQTNEELNERIEIYEEMKQIYEEFPAKPFLPQTALAIGDELFNRDRIEEAGIIMNWQLKDSDGSIHKLLEHFQEPELHS